MGFIGFMASGMGRLARMIVGLALVLVGLFWMDGAAGYIVAIVGLIPLAAGLFDVCVMAPLFGLPFFGPEIRRRTGTRA